MAETGKVETSKRRHCKLKPLICHLRSKYTQELRRGLSGTPLAGQVERFEQSGRKWNVSPILVASISGTESSFGSARCGFNIFGWGSCRGYNFGSFGEAIQTVTRSLRTDYMNGWHLRSVYAIGATYCACGSHWAEHTSWFMTARFGSSVAVTYR